MKYIAIDFETANEERRSPCAVGLAWVENGCVVKSKSWLIRPHELRFARMNKAIHGITENDVADKPEFPECWSLLRQHLVEQAVVAHNAAFDFSVLRATLDHYKIPYPEVEYLCTWKMAKSMWSGLCNYRLDTISAALGIPLVHHQAEADAVACAEIALRVGAETGGNDVFKVAESVGVYPGRLFPGGYTQCWQQQGKQNKSGKSKKPLPGGPLAGQCFVFTGTLESMVRSDAQALVEQRGGVVSNSVSTKVGYLVVGIQDYSRFTDGTKSSKMKKAEQVISNGGTIEIISETDFLEIVDL